MRFLLDVCGVHVGVKSSLSGVTPLHVAAKVCSACAQSSSSHGVGSAQKIVKHSSFSFDRCALKQRCVSGRTGEDARVPGDARSRCERCGQQRTDRYEGAFNAGFQCFGSSAFNMKTKLERVNTDLLSFVQWVMQYVAMFTHRHQNKAHCQNSFPVSLKMSEWLSGDPRSTPRPRQHNASIV